MLALAAAAAIAFKKATFLIAAVHMHIYACSCEAVTGPFMGATYRIHGHFMYIMHMYVTISSRRISGF